jgi:hypothetical protein
MKLEPAVVECLRKVSNGFWISRYDGVRLCALKLAEPGPIYGYVLTQAGIDALKAD